MFVFGFVQSLACAASLLLLLHPGHGSAASTGAPAQPPGNDDEWTGWGGNVYNNHWNYKNSLINSTSVGQLTQNCKLDYPVGVSATPVVLNYTAYYPTANGSFYALNYVTCELLWQVNVTQIIYDFQVPSALTQKYSLAISRTSPQIDGDVLYFGTQANALLVALDLSTGQLLATAQVNDHPLAICTMSPTAYGGKIFIGASSHEDAGPNDSSYKCCSFIGNFAAFTFDRKAKKFTRAWNVQTLPANQGWAGASVWGSQPSIDPKRNQVFFATGNLLIYPTEYQRCRNKPASCLPNNVWQDSVVAVDIATGKPNWRQSTTPLDGWLQACGFPGASTSNSPLCPVAPGPDSDFGMAPTFVPAALGDGTTGNDSVVVGQKNGNLFNINAANGDIQWVNAAGGDNSGSWLSWGVAVDSSSVYFTAINYGSKNWTVESSGVSINNSAWGALDLKSGKSTWDTPCPDYQLSYSPPGIVNDIVFVSQAGSSKVNIPGTVHALSKTGGSILHSLPVESVQHGGIMARGGFVMFGTGYAFNNPFESGSFHVYSLPGAVEEAKAQIATMTVKPSAAPTTSSTSVPKATQSGAPDKKSAASAVRRNGIMAVIYPVALFVVLHSWLD